MAATLLVSISPINVYADESKIDFEQYRIEAINQELLLRGYSNLQSFGITHALDEETRNNVEDLKNAEIVFMKFDDSGQLSTAESSEKGNVINNFVKETRDVEYIFTVSNEIASPSMATKSDVSIQSVLKDTIPTPAGADTGAFHRLKTPTSTRSLNFTGGVADDVTLPGYNFANTDGESAYLYTGIDNGETGIAEVGFGTYNGSKGKGWFPLFHARASHKVITQPGNEKDSEEYYFDYTKNYGSGNKTINGYKVFYKLAEKDEDPDPILTITYQIGYSTLYVIQFPDYKASNKSVKRVTAIAMPKGTSGKFKNPFTSYANWGNYRFLTQNGASTVYPGNVSGLIENTWSHGGSIDYIKNVISSTDRDEQYKIY
ncbi:hypothetical protein VQ056_07290 [Paenibacillus sp. JTLBN-2024]